MQAVYIDKKKTLVHSIFSQLFCFVLCFFFSSPFSIFFLLFSLLFFCSYKAIYKYNFKCKKHCDSSRSKLISGVVFFLFLFFWLLLIRLLLLTFKKMILHGFYKFASFRQFALVSHFSLDSIKENDRFGNTHLHFTHFVAIYAILYVRFYVTLQKQTFHRYNVLMP